MNNRSNKDLEGYTVCQTCQNVFKQNCYVDNKTGELKYEKYSNCPECRKKVSRLGQEAKKETKVSIRYEPYEWQRKFHESTARCKVISGAARSGKDFACDKEFIMKFIAMLNEDRPYSLVPRVHGWVIGPTYKILLTIERNFMKNFPRELVQNYNKEDHVIETVNGGIIEFRSADDPDSLVSVGLDICYITEAARIKYFEIVIGNITDRLKSPGRGYKGKGGFLLINSSPRGRTFFNKVCRFGVKGCGDYRPGWETWYISIWENPNEAKKRYKYYNSLTQEWDLDEPEYLGAKTYEEDLKLSRSDWQYKEDILGLPQDQDGAQFQNFREKAVIERPNLKDGEMRNYIKRIQTPVIGYTYSIGYDPAKKIDGAWAVVYCENTGEVVEILKMEKVNYSTQINVYIKDLVKKWNYAMVRYGQTGLGESLESLFALAGIATVPYPEQSKNKEKLVENLTTLVNEGRFKIYNINDISEIAIRQFEDYTRFTSETTNNVRFANGTAGGHDDAVSASYFAVADVIYSDVVEALNSSYDGSFLPVNKGEKKYTNTGGFF